MEYGSMSELKKSREFAKVRCTETWIPKKRRPRAPSTKYVHHWYGFYWNVSVWNICELSLGPHIERYWEYGEKIVGKTTIHFVMMSPLILLSRTGVCMHRHKRKYVLLLLSIVKFNVEYSMRTVTTNSRLLLVVSDFKEDNATSLCLVLVLSFQ